MKKLSSLLLALLACITFANAEIYNGTCGANLTWTLNTEDSTLTINGTGEMFDYYYSNHPWYSYSSSIKSVILTDRLTTIGDCAFRDCGRLTSITIPNSVTYIGRWAFDNCTGLTSITIPNSVTNIGEQAFGYCSSLISVTIPNSVISIGQDAFHSCNSLPVENNLRYADTYLVEVVDKSLSSYSIKEGTRWIGESAFSDCRNLISIDIPNSVIGVGMGAFAQCTSLTVPVYNAHVFAYMPTSYIGAYTIPDGIESIVGAAFAGCTGLTSITIPNSVTNIGEQAFGYCSSLISVTIPNSVISIGQDAFHSCNSLPVENNLRYADTYLVEAVEHGASSTSIKEGTRWIGDRAFEYCTELTSIEIPNSVISIGNSAFDHCFGLTSVTIPNSVKHIGNKAFMTCDGLTSITIPNSVTSIGEEAFSSCTHLISIEIPNSVVSIEYGTFSNCEGLTSVAIPNSVTSIREEAFSHCKGLTSITIPNSVTSIGRQAFEYCIGLTSINIPNRVTSIGEYAFFVCTGLTSITIPNSVVTIGYDAFANCKSLTSVAIPNSVISIDGSAFEDCTSLASVTLPNSVTKIEYETFAGCTNLVSITIPNSIIGIANRAFFGCSSLASIYMESSTPPSIGSYTFKNISSNAIFYVPFGSREAYKSANYWKDYTIVVQGLTAESVPLPTSCSIRCGDETLQSIIASVGIEGGETFDGNILEQTGLDPNTEYTDQNIILTAYTGETEIINVSFTTTALELTTQQSQPVSSNTAILLAQTNMADIEISCGFEWKRTNAPDDMPGNKVFCPVANGLMAGRLKGLKDDVYYKYRAFYESKAGNMYYGDWQYIFTGDVTVEFEPILYTYPASSVTENEATLKGYALAGSEDFTEQGFEYWAESRTNKAPRHTAAIGEHHTVTASGISMKATLTDLDPGTVYRYRSYAKTDSQMLYGSEMTLTTRGEYPDDPQAIEDIQTDVPQATKILHEGHIYILRGEHIFNTQGKMVK